MTRFDSSQLEFHSKNTRKIKTFKKIKPKDTKKRFKKNKNKK